MFYGTTPSEIRNYLGSEIKKIKPKRIIEPCAGNFVASQIAAKLLPDIKIISGDVSPYSVAIGFGLTNQEGITPTEKLKTLFPFLYERQDPLSIAVNTIIIAEALTCLGKTHIKYYEILLKDMVSNQKIYYEKIKEKIIKIKTLFKNFEFLGKDACETIKIVKEGDFILYDPPYYQGDYEKMYAHLDDFYNYPEIPYNDINESIREEHIEFLRLKKSHVYFRPENEINFKGMKKCFEHEYKQGKKYYLYSNNPVKKVIKRTVMLREIQKKYDVIYYNDILTLKSRVIIEKIESKVCNHYRLLWTKKAIIKDTGEMFGLFIDGKLSGVISIMSSIKFGTDYAVIVADATPSHTNYKRFSKIVLYVILTEEFLQRVNNVTMYEHLGFATNAYTNNNVSMKYRGLFKLVARKPGVSGYKYTLGYRTKKMRAKTIKQSYKEWFQKYGKITRN